MKNIRVTLDVFFSFFYHIFHSALFHFLEVQSMTNIKRI